MLSDKGLKDIHALIASCDELINGRYIFAENIIEKILYNISQSEEVYALISECMQNFNFEREFNRAKIKLPTKDGYFVMPESKAIILPLVFCILVDIRDKKINFHEFVKNYFTSEDINEFENFAQTVIVPFKNALIYCFDLDKEISNEHIREEKQLNDTQVQHVDEAEQTEQPTEPKVEPADDDFDPRLQTFMSGVHLVCSQMRQELASDPKVKQDLKNDVDYLLNILMECTDKLDIKNVSAYIVAIDYIARPIKSLRFLAQELRQKLIEFYE